MEKTKKWLYRILILILIILAIFIGYFYYQNKLQLIKKSSVQQQNLTVYLKLPDQKDFIKQEVNVGKTALELTKERANIVTKGDGANAYIIKINGKVAEDLKKEFWSFYVNDKMAEMGAGSYKLKEGDKIEWRIEKY